MLKTYFRINEANGISIFTDSDNHAAINAVVVKTKGTELEIIKKVKNKKSIAQLKDALAVKVPVALNLTGKGVLIKTIEGTDPITATNFNRVVPNGNWDEFYVQQFEAGERSFIAIIRKNDADRWLKELKNNGYEVLMLSLGPFVIQHVLPQLNFYDTEVIFNGHHIDRDSKGQWLSYKYHQTDQAPFPVKVENEKLDEQLLLPYASAFQLLLAPDIEPIGADLPVLTFGLKAALTDKKIIVSSVLALGVLFILLLANSFLFTRYTSQNEALALRTMQTEHSSKDLDSLARRIKKSEALLDSLGWEDNLNQSVLVDRLAQLLPPDVQLIDLAVNPIDRSHENQSQKITFLQRKISVTGTTQRIVLVNEWLERIKSLPWVKDAQLKHYTYNNQENTGVFNLMIAY